MMTADELIAFEAEVKELFERGAILGPVHLSNGNEKELIEIFADVRPQDWVFSTWRNHYHALLKGIPRDVVLKQIVHGHSMHLSSVEHRFMSSSIVGGMLPIAVGVAHSNVAHVWCFLGDMAASCGMYRDCLQYARGHDLPITFVIEDNGFSTGTPTQETWGGYVEPTDGWKVRRYKYTSKYPHIGAGKRVTM